jgi:hypothetical protein
MQPIRNQALRRSFSPREDTDNIGDGSQQHHRPPLGVELTGYRLLATTVVLGLGISKAVYSYRGQALISNTLDWVAGTLYAFMYASTFCGAALRVRGWSSQVLTGCSGLG